MPTFQYVAKRGPTDVIEGVLEADNRAHVLSRLLDQGYTPVRITEAAAATGAALRPLLKRDGGVPSAHLNQFTRQFASLMRSQVPLLRAVGIMKDQSGSPRLSQILAQLEEDIRQGHTLSESLGKFPKTFSPLYLSLIRSGELSGSLDRVLDRLADQAERDEALQAKVRAALVYPAFVGVVGIGTVIFLLTFVMPKLLRLFEGFGSRLPLPTRLLLALTHACQQWWCWAILAVLIAGPVLLFRARGDAGRLLFDRLTLRLPLLGSLICKLEFARFARAFGLLLEHGVPILQSTEVAVPVVSHRVIRRELSRLMAALRDGQSLARCLQQLSVATPFVTQTIAVGEEGGKVAEALAEIATFYERDVERLMQTLAALLEPAMILMVGGAVGFIVMAVLLPIFEMSVVAR